MYLTIYSNDFDDGEDVFGNGLAGKVFLDPGKNEGPDGIAFGNGISDAIAAIVDKNVAIDEIVFCYKDEKNGQMFKRFKINTYGQDCGVV